MLSYRRKAYEYRVRLKVLKVGALAASLLGLFVLMLYIIALLHL